MTSYCRRLTAGAGSSDLSIRLRQPSRAAKISRLPRNYANQRQGIVLRSRRCLVEAVGAVGASGAWERSDGADGEEKVLVPRSYAVGDLAEKRGTDERTVEEEEENGNRERKKSRDRTIKVVVAAAVTVVMGVGNRVLYKLALVPLKQYPFFLAQLATFGRNNIACIVSLPTQAMAQRLKGSFARGRG
ncbi:hypothetical protein CJ030_MR1G019987 [Morella rubra]|uniref:Uncharacterized protein n=1 Tax=Morella rubra TaxID=262757 RepID=A0A6A1WSD4_9ROSI|nr:hypothetical protein CJ030_MR1G019987 [Morella rubra]